MTRSAILGRTLAPHANIPVELDVGVLVESRLLVQANSGAGKSWALRRLLEQTHGQVQHLVLDVEDEFHTLRERFDYVLAGRGAGGDCPADLRSATLLARRLLELGVSAVVSLYELKKHERYRFVKLFLESLMAAPRDLWHPVMVVIDEAHIFCPQSGSAESSEAVIDLMTRGRKRGFCGVLATQRISKIDKDAVAECNDKLIGRSALDLDMKRAGEELGFTSKEQLLSLRNMPAGEFFAFGPTLSREVIRLKVGDVATTHPRASQPAAVSHPDGGGGGAARGVSEEDVRAVAFSIFSYEFFHDMRCEGDDWNGYDTAQEAWDVLDDDPTSDDTRAGWYVTARAAIRLGARVAKDGT